LVKKPREIYQENDGSAYSELHLVNKQGVCREFIAGKVNIHSLAWSHDNRFIYYLAKRKKDDFTAIYRIPIDGGESEKVVSSKTDILAFSLNGFTSKLIYLAKFKIKAYEESNKNNQAYRVDLDNPTKHNPLGLKLHIHSLVYHPSKEEILMRVSPTSLTDDNYMYSQYHIYDSKGKLVRAFKTNGKLGKASWSISGNKVAIIASEDIHDPAEGRLIIADVKTGEITKPIENYQGHIRDVDWLSDTQVFFLGHVGTKSEVSLLNLNDQSMMPRAALGDVVFTSIDVNPFAQSIVGLGSSDKHPTELFDLSKKELKRLTHLNTWLADIKMPQQETLTYSARDSVSLQGILVYPINYVKGKPYPLIMMVHGGPESHISDAWIDRYISPVKYAASQGFVVFLPNYRGSTGRGVEFSKKGQADYAGGEFNDLVDAINYLSDKGIIDKQYVGITGGSYGGYAAGWGATALSKYFAASVMFVGVSDQVSQFGTTDIPEEMYLVHARSYPWERWQWMLERSPIYHTDKAKTPLLILHGEKDNRVDPGQSVTMYRYMKTRTKTPVRLIFYPDEGHGNKKSAAQLDYAMRLMRWMTFYLSGQNKGSKLPPLELDHKNKLEKNLTKTVSR